MAGLEVAGSAVGIASLGIQVCQGLLSYYESWKGYKAEVATTYNSIENLAKTLKLLQESLSRTTLDPTRVERVQKCLDSCDDSLSQLQNKLRKLQTYSVPHGWRQKAWTELQRTFYPLRESTLVKLRELTSELQHHVSLALQVLQLDVTCDSQDILAQIETLTRDTTSRTVGIEATVTGITIQNETLSNAVHGIATAQQMASFRTIVDWLSPVDPWINHHAARRHHEFQTGSWLLQSSQYQRWKADAVSKLWLHGKAGCGKTILCSTVIEDIKAHCEHASNTGYAIYYFTFSDGRKQSYKSFLSSLVAQLAWKEPAQSALRRIYESAHCSSPSLEVLEDVLSSAMRHYDDVFILLDALDECPEDNDIREDVLNCLHQLTGDTPNLRLLCTSRTLLGIKDSMARLEACDLSIDSAIVDADIRRYVRAELSRDRKLNRLDEHTKSLIERTLTQKADGMFRWAYCQLHELKQLKSSRPKRFEEALETLPATLDETYERMLTRINERDRKDALTALRWLAFAENPLTLSEIAEACIIDPDGDGTVETDNKPGLEDVLEILEGLVTVDRSLEDHHYEDDSSLSPASDSSEAGDSSHACFESIRNTRVRLAHFSVKEYLESERIAKSDARHFSLKSEKEHRYLARSCLIYIEHYSKAEKKEAKWLDLLTFPLLDYSARSWFYHSRLQHSGDVSREISFLSSEVLRLTWVFIYDPEQIWRWRYRTKQKLGSGLYYACYLGLEMTVAKLLEAGADVNTSGGRFGNALTAASHEGHKGIVTLLLYAGADVNATGWVDGSALQAASMGGDETIVKALLEAGANINSERGTFGNALQTACAHGKQQVARMLLEAGADVNAVGGLYANALQAALAEGHDHIANMLIESAANIHARGGLYDNMLQAASLGGLEDIIKMLLHGGADVNLQGGHFGNALQAASTNGHVEVVKMLLEQGADTNARGGIYGTALQAASDDGQVKIVEVLLEHGADVNAQGRYPGNALQAASLDGNAKVVEMLLEHGANVNAQGGRFSSALEAATFDGAVEVVKMLLEQGADVNAQGRFGSALEAASLDGNAKVVEMLLEHGADVNARGELFGGALRAASGRDTQRHKKVVEILIANGASLDE